MAENKRIYWLRLRADFFESPKIRKLRRLPGGDGYLVIYLRIQQLTVQTGGILTRKGTEQDLAEELALELDEDADTIRALLAWLEENGLCQTSDHNRFFFPQAAENIGSETESTIRSRECRKRSQMLQCNNDATPEKKEPKKSKRPSESEEDNGYKGLYIMHSYFSNSTGGILGLSDAEMSALRRTYPEVDEYAERMAHYAMKTGTVVTEYAERELRRWMDADRAAKTRRRPLKNSSMTRPDAATFVPFWLVEEKTQNEKETRQ